ncbi:RNA 2',3'-cyclic phosphodiesterase [Bacteroidota bacterium]
MIRLFIALKIPDDVKDKILNVCHELSDSPELFKWETPGKIHLTLKFIGEVEEELVSSIAKEIAFVEEYNSFNFNVTKFGFFYRNDVPGILWAGLQTDERISTLVEQLNERLSIFSIPVERRKLKPHLTMLRLKKNPGSSFVSKFKEYSFDNWSFNSSEISLIKSELFPSGARYTDIKKYNLK